MRTRIVMLALVAAGVLTVTAAPSTFAQKSAAPPLSPELQATLDDIQQTLGSVPTFLQQFPPQALPGAWRIMKQLQLSLTTAIPGKYKELIGLAVAAQIPCSYCIYFHTEAAKLNGASETEIHEAIAMASLTRMYSTVLNGEGQEMGSYREEIQKAVQHAQAGGAPPPDIDVTDAASADQDVQATFGFLPSFMKAVPESFAPGAWLEMKDFEMNPETAIPNKYKSLISLAVSSQIPCAYCVYSDKEFSRLDGATDEEIEEAIAMAAVTRHWSTFLNGAQIDPATFHKEADAIMKHFRESTAGK